MEPEEKDRLSPRRLALEKLRAFFAGDGGAPV
jgi:inosine/xanthosine triphosphate pyrophosphatase family protein